MNNNPNSGAQPAYLRWAEPGSGVIFGENVNIDPQCLELGHNMTTSYRGLFTYGRIAV
jgi:hypothetical protein